MTPEYKRTIHRALMSYRAQCVILFDDMSEADFKEEMVRKDFYSKEIVRCHSMIKDLDEKGVIE